MESKYNKITDYRSFDVYDVKRALRQVIDEIDENILPFEEIKYFSVRVTRTNKLNVDILSRNV